MKWRYKKLSIHNYLLLIKNILSTNHFSLIIKYLKYKKNNIYFNIKKYLFTILKNKVFKIRYKYLIDLFITIFGVNKKKNKLKTIYE